MSSHGQVASSCVVLQNQSNRAELLTSHTSVILARQTSLVFLVGDSLVPASVPLFKRVALP